MTITSILELPIEIVEKIIDLVDDKNSLLGLATITHFKDIIYERLFQNLNIFHNRNDSIHGKFISFYCISKFLNFLDDYNNYVPNEILTNIDTLYELFEIKHINFKNTKINLIIHPHHTIEDLEFSIKNFKINSIILKPDFDYHLIGNYHKKLKLENEKFRNLTLPNTLEKFDMAYNNIFLRNLPHSLRELTLTEIDDLNSIKLPLSLESLSLSKCKMSGVMLDLSYLHQLKSFELEGRIRNDNNFSPEKLRLPSSVESICLNFYDFRNLNNLSDYKDLKVLKLKRCRGSILLFNTILPPHLEHLSIDDIFEDSVNPDDIISHGATMNLNNVAMNYPLGDHVDEEDLWYDIIGENIFPSTLKILKLTDIGGLTLGFQLNLPNLEELVISSFIKGDYESFINENFINLRKLTMIFCFARIELVKFPKKLEYLNLQDNGRTSFEPLNLIYLNRLKHLIIRDFQLTSITEQISPNLKILDISSAGVSKLYHQKNLEKLTLTTSRKPDDIYINNLKSLDLTIRVVDRLEDRSSKFFDYKFDSCCYLKELILRLEIGNISNLTFPDTIESLDITCNFRITTFYGGPDNFEISDTKLIKNDLQKDLYNISKCYKLKSFKLKNCNIELFSFDNLPKNLENFSIIKSKLKSIYGTLKNLENLKSLNLELNRIGDDGLKNCLFSSPKLEIIDLNWNSIDNIDCINIEDCPRLVELNLMNQSIKFHVTDEFEEELKLSCPRLSVIRGYKETNKKRHIVNGNVY
ncbi:uncharacterized protein KGF55_005311 [Candida pseudojiufengensis]|uniref:uncharacterized protein n=1 Tax=Candida pseudojiufengensis TaxID=497109 RepID=UPI00222421DB|nr:uncharacterized protein KGF55_005311 [Candida pseudojiufengensis]KAI5959483.1 hypothetical protein KGF55_005311 [Candida pseudojiufengensis]